MVPNVLFNHKILCIILPLEHYTFELTPYWPTELAPSSIPHKGEGRGICWWGLIFCSCPYIFVNYFFLIGAISIGYPLEVNFFSTLTTCLQFRRQILPLYTARRIMLHFHHFWKFNLFIPKISLVICFTVCFTILKMLVWRYWYLIYWLSPNFYFTIFS